MPEGAYESRQDNNSLGKAAGVIGVIALVLSFVPIIGFVSWVLAPLSILFGLIALRKSPRSWAIVGAITGTIALVICFTWISAADEVGKAVNADTFNNTGDQQNLAEAPVMEAEVEQIWSDIDGNKVAAGQKYGGKRLSFSDEIIADFAGDAANPAIQIVAKREEFIVYSVSARFDKSAGGAIAAMSKGDKVSFICTEIKEGFGQGYSLSGCVLK